MTWKRQPILKSMWWLNVWSFVFILNDLTVRIALYRKVMPSRISMKTLITAKLSFLKMLFSGVLYFRPAVDQCEKKYIFIDSEPQKHGATVKSVKFNSVSLTAVSRSLVLFSVSAIHFKCLSAIRTLAQVLHVTCSTPNVYSSKLKAHWAPKANNKQEHRAERKLTWWNTGSFHCK